MGGRTLPLVPIARSVLRWAPRIMALLVAGVLFAYVVVNYGDAAWLPPVRWSVFVIFTALIFWDVVVDHRRNWRRAMFWLSLLGLFTFHTMGYALVLTKVVEFRAIWFLPISIAELVLLLQILRALGFDDEPLPSAGNTQDRVGNGRG